MVNLDCALLRVGKDFSFVAIEVVQVALGKHSVSLKSSLKCNVGTPLILQDVTLPISEVKVDEDVVEVYFDVITHHEMREHYGKVKRKLVFYPALTYPAAVVRIEVRLWQG